MRRQPTTPSTDAELLKTIRRILQQVSAIDAAIEGQHDNQAVVLILGNTGSGKSTFVNYLAGCRMREVDGDGLETVIEADDPIMEIGHGFESKTTYPQLYAHAEAELCYCDCPGFLDHRGPAYDIALAFAIKKILRTRSVKGIIVMVNYNALIADKARNLRGTIDLLKRLFGVTDTEILAYLSCIRLLVSKAHSEEDITATGLKAFMSEVDRPLMGALGARVLFYDPLDREEAIARGAFSRSQILAVIQGFPGIRNDAGIVGYPLSVESRRTLSAVAVSFENRLRDHLSSWNVTAIKNLMIPLKRLCLIDDALILEACHRIESILRDRIALLVDHENALRILTEIRQQLPGFKKEVKAVTLQIQEKRQEDDRRRKQLVKEKAARQKAEKAAAKAREKARQLEEKHITLLVTVCEQGDLEKVKIYVKACRNPHAISTDGKHPLGAAIWGLNIGVVKYLLKQVYHQDIGVIQAALMTNQDVYGAEFPDFVPVAALTFQNLYDYYQVPYEGGTKTLFSDWLWKLTGSRGGALEHVLPSNNNNVITVSRVENRLECPRSSKVQTARIRKGRSIWHFGPFCERYKTCLKQKAQLQDYIKSIKNSASRYRVQAPRAATTTTGAEAATVTVTTTTSGVTL